MVLSGSTQSSGLLKQTTTKICQFWTISLTTVTSFLVGSGVATVYSRHMKNRCFVIKVSWLEKELCLLMA